MYSCTWCTCPYSACDKQGASPFVLLVAVLQVTYGINSYGPLYLTHLLIPTLQQTASKSAGAGTPGKTRIVWTSSPAETVGETDFDDLK